MATIPADHESFDAQGINKYGPGVVTFSYDAAVMEGKFFSELITVYGGVFQLQLFNTGD